MSKIFVTRKNSL